ncbi:MAG TPA: putative Ig domain-containing protein, partial [Aggregatilineales bacterium]|nr:putative Ig domain-containing protein [Aggregatilineales bacterium]
GANSSNIGDSNVVLVANYLGSPSSPLTDCVLNSDTAKGGDCFPAWEPAALDPNASPTQTLTPTPSGIEFTPYFQVTPTASVVPSLTPPPNCTSNCPTPVVINVGMSGRAALVGQATVWNLSASGGTGPYTMLVVNPGNLPPGMNLTGNSTTGYAISGTPNTPGAYTFTVSATDAKGNSGSATFTVSIYSIKPKALPNGQATVAYSQTFTVLGGTLPISFIPQSGPACGSTNFALPCGMNLSALGVISGTTTEVGTFSFNVQFSDKNNNAISVPYTLTINPGKPAKMIYVSGSGNTARVSTAFPPLIVLVEDGAGNPVQGGITVTFTSVAAGTGADVQGSPLTATTAANGQASVTPTANTKAGGPYTVTVSSAGTNTIPFDLTNLAGNAGKLDFACTLCQEPTTTAAGQAITPAILVAVEDQFGNVLSGDNGTSVMIGIQNNPGVPPGTLSGTLTQADVNGIATFSGLSIDKTGSGYTLIANSSGLLSAISAAFNITPGPATHFQVSAPTMATAGVAFPFTVTALDQFNNTATNYAGTVHFTKSDAGAGSAVPANSTLSSGVGTFTATLVTAGIQTLTATDTVTSSITGTSNNITVSAAAATHFVVSAPASATAGVAFNFTVTALDQFNNTATGYVGTVHFTKSDAGAGSAVPADSTLTNGVGTFTATLVTAGIQTLTATDTVTSSITGTSNNITVNPGAPIVTITSGNPQSAVVNTPFGTALSVNVKDAFGNAIGGAIVTYTGPGAGAGITSSPTDTTDISGNTSGVIVTANTIPGSYSVTASVTTSAGTGSANFSLTNTPGPATHFMVALFPSGKTVGFGGTFTVTAQDQYGNTDTNYVGTVTFTSNDTAALLPVNYTFTAGDQGVHNTFQAMFNTAGNSQYIQATDTSNNTITGKQTPIVVHIKIGPPSIPSATAGSFYNYPLTELGGTAPFVGTLTGAPATITLDPATGVLSGTPTGGDVGQYSLSITITDSNLATGSINYTFYVNKITLTPASLPDGMIGTVYVQGTAFSLTGSGLSTPYSYAQTGGTLPTGLSVGATALTGTPTAEGIYTFTIKGSDSSGTPKTASNVYTVKICPQPSSITISPDPSTLPNMSNGNSYSFTFTASGGLSPYTYTHTGSLPAGMSLSSNGVLAGTVSATGPYSFTIMATDSLGCASSSSGTGIGLSIAARRSAIKVPTPSATPRPRPTWVPSPTPNAKGNGKGNGNGNGNGNGSGNGNGNGNGGIGNGNGNGNGKHAPAGPASPYVLIALFLASLSAVRLRLGDRT